MLTPDQLATRRDGISATDVAAILGQHPYRSRIDVWREKRGETPEYEDSDRSKWGQLLEPVIRANYEQERSCRVIVPTTLRGKGADGWMVATPDGIVYPSATESSHRDGVSTDAERGLEIKCHTTRLWHLYGEEGTDEVPPHELCQCLWGMAVTGLDRWDLVAFIDGLPRIYTVQRDDELIGIMRDQAQRFIVDNVRGGAVPDPDGSDAYEEFLAARWKTSAADLVDIGDDTETFSLIERGKELRDTIATSEDQLKVIVQQLKAKIGERGGLTWKDTKGKPLRCSWKHTKLQYSTNYEAIMREMITTAALAVSAKRADVKRLHECLRTHHGYIGASTQIAALEGKPAAEILGAIVDALSEIANNLTEAKHTKTFTTRPFLWPSQWNRGKGFV